MQMGSWQRAAKIEDDLDVEWYFLFLKERGMSFCLFSSHLFSLLMLQCAKIHLTK